MAMSNTMAIASMYIRALCQSNARAFGADEFRPCLGSSRQRVEVFCATWQYAQRRLAGPSVLFGRLAMDHSRAYRWRQLAEHVSAAVLERKVRIG